MAKRDPKTGVNVWVAESLVQKLDQHLRQLAAKIGVPGAKISRSQYLVALLQKDLEGAKT